MELMYTEKQRDDESSDRERVEMQKRKPIEAFMK